MNSKDKLDQIYSLINQKEKIIVMSGAGISTAANIPDFRSSGTGLYDQFKIDGASDPMSLFSLKFFKTNPSHFYEAAFKLYPLVKNAQPTITHKLIKLLNDKGKLLRHYTQNVDGLDLLANLPEKKLIEVHGNARSGTCLKCEKKYSLEQIEPHILKNEIPKCTNCHTGIIKPDVVLFGESLPKRFLDKVSKDFKKCDLLIVIGTSLIVQPFASLIDRVNKECPRIFINKTNFEDLSETETDKIIIDDCNNVCTKLYDKIL